MAISLPLPVYGHQQGVKLLAATVAPDAADRSWIARRGSSTICLPHRCLPIAPRLNLFALGSVGVTISPVSIAIAWEHGPDGLTEAIIPWDPRSCLIMAIRGEIRKEDPPCVQKCPVCRRFFVRTSRRQYQDRQRINGPVGRQHPRPPRYADSSNRCSGARGPCRRLSSRSSLDPAPCGGAACGRLRTFCNPAFTRGLRCTKEHFGASRYSRTGEGAVAHRAQTHATPRASGGTRSRVSGTIVTSKHQHFAAAGSSAIAQVISDN
jgi:hypothetical protein